MNGQRPQRLVDGRRWQAGVQAHQTRAQIAGEHRLACAGAVRCAARPEGFVVLGVDGLPAELVLQMRGDRRLHQTVLAVDARDRHCIRSPTVVLMDYEDSFSANSL